MVKTKSENHVPTLIMFMLHFPQKKKISKRTKFNFVVMSHSALTSGKGIVVILPSNYMSYVTL
jgi:hypothetical protein